MGFMEIRKNEYCETLLCRDRTWLLLVCLIALLSARPIQVTLGHLGQSPRHEVAYATSLCVCVSPSSTASSA